MAGEKVYAKIYVLGSLRDLGRGDKMPRSWRDIQFLGPLAQVRGILPSAPLSE
jgi:hypothetical protein